MILRLDLEDPKIYNLKIHSKLFVNTILPDAAIALIAVVDVVVKTVNKFNVVTGAGVVATFDWHASN